MEDEGDKTNGGGGGKGRKIEQLVERRAGKGGRWISLKTGEKKEIWKKKTTKKKVNKKKSFLTS